MSGQDAIKNRRTNAVSVVELKRLLIDLREKKPTACVRFRLLGELWSKHFYSIAAVTDKGVVLKDDNSNNFIAVSNLTDVVQFEIDEPFQGFRPYNHYDVNPSADFHLQ